MVGRDDRQVRVVVAQNQQAGIRKIDTSVPVAGDAGVDAGKLFRKQVHGPEEAGAEQIVDLPGPGRDEKIQEVIDLADTSFAGQPRPRNAAGKLDGPRMMPIAAITQGDEKAGINERVCGRTHGNRPCWSKGRRVRSRCR